MNYSLMSVSEGVLKCFFAILFNSKEFLDGLIAQWLIFCLLGFSCAASLFFAGNRSSFSSSFHLIKSNTEILHWAADNYL